VGERNSDAHSREIIAAMSVKTSRSSWENSSAGRGFESMRHRAPLASVSGMSCARSFSGMGR
jgi:hypothetical protein